MSKPIKLIQSADTRQWHSNIIARNGEVVSTTEPVKRKAFALVSVEAAARAIFKAYGVPFPEGVEPKIEYLPAPRRKKLAINRANDLTSNIEA